MFRKPFANADTQQDVKPWEKRFEKGGKAVEEEEGESVAESGRFFIRNLPYVCSEEDLEELFSKYGPLSEVYLPVDKLTKKPKGFAFITFMMPEHAVKAFSDLDGTVFKVGLYSYYKHKADYNNLVLVTNDKQ